MQRLELYEGLQKQSSSWDWVSSAVAPGVVDSADVIAVLSNEAMQPVMACVLLLYGVRRRPLRP
jgi:hypothetical protein